MKLKESKTLAEVDRPRLIDQIAETLHGVKSHQLPSVCDRLGLEPGTPDEAFSSKRSYVKNRIKTFSNSDLLQFARRVGREHPSFALSEFLHALDEHMDGFTLTDITRRSILTALNDIKLFGELEPLSTLAKVWPHYSQPIDFGAVVGCPSSPKSNQEVLEEAGAMSCSRTTFFRFLEFIVSPNVRRKDDCATVVELLNQYLVLDGFCLQPTGVLSGHPVFTIERKSDGVSGKPKNLIFAASGPKPQIVLEDAINNDIKITRNEEFCLVYDLPIGVDGLTKGDLIAWWQDRENISDEATARKSLYKRLLESVEKVSQGQVNVFKTYYEQFKKLGNDLPALIPEVYLHYDPYTINQLGGVKRLARQRMDFLILFNSTTRVVIEVDGKQHFSTSDGKASLNEYANMMSADRELHLAGYEVYRFGANEVVGEESTELIERFFLKLMKKHLAKTTLAELEK